MPNTQEDIAEARRAVHVHCPACKAIAGQPCRPLKTAVPALGVHQERVDFLIDFEAERAIQVDAFRKYPTEETLAELPLLQ